MSCPVCNGAVPDSYGAIEKTYCSNACKQRAYRQRKKAKETAKKSTGEMFVYMAVDLILERLPLTERETYSTRLWHILDKQPDVNTQLEVVDLIKSAGA